MRYYNHKKKEYCYKMKKTDLRSVVDLRNDIRKLLQKHGDLSNSKLLKLLREDHKGISTERLDEALDDLYRMGEIRSVVKGSSYGLYISYYYSKGLPPEKTVLESIINSLKEEPSCKEALSQELSIPMPVINVLIYQLTKEGKIERRGREYRVKGYKKPSEPKPEPIPKKPKPIKIRSPVSPWLKRMILDELPGRVSNAKPLSEEWGIPLEDVLNAMRELVREGILKRCNMGWYIIDNDIAIIAHYYKYSCLNPQKYESHKLYLHFAPEVGTGGISKNITRVGPREYRVIL